MKTNFSSIQLDYRE